mmetsp:Transcript_13523/g.56787  ORF Transcript_13523/g.56787 Transcript_13523/m.56787 type:complete len:91 (+) Transcript_13523:629-901(+)
MSAETSKREREKKQYRAFSSPKRSARLFARRGADRRRRGASGGCGVGRKRPYAREEEVCRRDREARACVANSSFRRLRVGERTELIESAL